MLVYSRSFKSLNEKIKILTNIVYISIITHAFVNVFIPMSGWTLYLLKNNTDRLLSISQPPCRYLSRLCNLFSKFNC